MNQSINTDSKNIKEPQQKYRLGTVSIKILGGLNRFYRRLTSPSKTALYATDCSKAVVLVLFLLCVALWFSLRGVSC